jgi:hypothetical protein
MRVNDYALATPAAGDKLFGSNAAGDQKQFAITNFTNAVFQYEIGEYVEDRGGVIFHRYLDGDTQNYLVVSIVNQSVGQAWSNVTSPNIGTTSQSTWDGLTNSNAIVAQSGQTSSAAKLCLDLTVGTISDWYLPAIDELNLIYNNRFSLNRTLSGNSSYGAISTATQITNNVYWSSTESATSGNAFELSMAGHTVSQNGKSATNYVRAIRKFSI